MEHSSDMQTVVFTLGQEEYAVDINTVQEIIKMPAITMLPNTDDSMLGIINIRGSIIPVIDLKLKLIDVQTDYNSDTRIIIIEINEFKMGLIVDKVSEVIMIRSDLVVPVQQIISGARADYVLGVAKLEGRLLILLNANKLSGHLELDQLSIKANN